RLTRASIRAHRRLLDSPRSRRRRAMKAGILAWASAALASAASGALALAVVAATPQGEVAQVRQVTVKFGEAVVPFGDLRLPDPFTIACRGANVPAGSGRWANDRVWLYDFREPLGPGTTCTATLRSDWKTATTSGAAAAPAGAASAAPVSGTTRFTFSTGGPAIVAVQPGRGRGVAAGQRFLTWLC